MTVTVLSEKIGREAPWSRGQPGMSIVDLGEDSLRTPLTQTILDELPELIRPINVSLGASNLL